MVATDLDRATEECIRCWEEGMGMKVPRNEGGKEGKTVGIASKTRVRRRLESLLKRRNIIVKRKVRNLGVDYAAGGDVSRAANVVRQDRALKMKGRFGRANRMGQGVASSITNVALVPSALHGAVIHGVIGHQLDSITQVSIK